MFDGKQLGEAIVEQVREFVGRAVSTLAGRVEALEKRAPVPGPQGERGADGPQGIAGRDGAPGPQGERGLDGAAGKDGAPGRDGANGKDGIDGKDGAPGRDGAQGERGLPGKDGAQGPQGAVGLQGKDGALGPVGKDGAPGIHGKDAPPVDEDAIVARCTSRIPIPKDGRDGRDGAPGAEGARGADGINGKDGADGKDGRDGLSIDDFEVSLEGRTFTFALRCGERVVEKQIKVPFPVDCGVYRNGKSYERGDVVTYGGSQWIALKDTGSKPPSDDWRCQVQRGRDGKDAQ